MPTSGSRSSASNCSPSTPASWLPASTPTLRFAEAANRLAIGSEPKGLSDLVSDVKGSGSTKSKTRGVLEGVGETLGELLGGSGSEREPAPRRRKTSGHPGPANARTARRPRGRVHLRPDRTRGLRPIVGAGPLRAGGPLREIVDESPKATALLEEIRDKPEELARDARIALGEIIGHILETTREADTRTTIDVLSPLTDTVTVRDPTHDEDAVQIAVLFEVDRRTNSNRQSGSCPNAGTTRSPCASSGRWHPPTSSSPAGADRSDRFAAELRCCIGRPIEWPRPGVVGGNAPPTG